MEILSVVERNPGLHTAEIARRLGVGWTSVQHHVRQLMAEGALVPVREGTRVLLATGNVPRHRVRQIVHITDPTRRRLLTLIRDRPGIRIVELAASLRSSRKVVRRRVTALESAGLVGRSADYHPRFQLTASGRKLLSHPRSS